MVRNVGGSAHHRQGPSSLQMRRREPRSPWGSLILWLIFGSLRLCQAFTTKPKTFTYYTWTPRRAAPDFLVLRVAPPWWRKRTVDPRMPFDVSSHGVCRGRSSSGGLNYSLSPHLCRNWRRQIPGKWILKCFVTSRGNSTPHLPPRADVEVHISPASRTESMSSQIPAVLLGPRGQKTDMGKQMLYGLCIPPRVRWFKYFMFFQTSCSLRISMSTYVWQCNRGGV